MGWLFVTILIPLVAPVLLMAVYGALTLPPRFKAKTKLVMPIKDCQLSWGRHVLVCNGSLVIMD